MRTMHWRERIHSATLWTAHDCGPFWLRILMHCVFKYIWAKGPKTWLYRGQTPCSGLRNQHRPWRRRKRWNLKISCVRWRHVLPFMKALPISFSDQPYLPGKHKGKRTIYTEPPLLKKARREARRRRSHSKYQSRLQLRLRSPRL